MRLFCFGKSVLFSQVLSTVMVSHTENDFAGFFVLNKWEFLLSTVQYEKFSNSMHSAAFS